MRSHPEEAKPSARVQKVEAQSPLEKPKPPEEAKPDETSAGVQKVEAQQSPPEKPPEAKPDETSTRVQKVEAKSLREKPPEAKPETSKGVPQVEAQQSPREKPPEAKPDETSARVLQVEAQSPGEKPPEAKPEAPISYEYGYDAMHGRVWRKEIRGPHAKNRGPVEWSKHPVRDPSKKPDDDVVFTFDDGSEYIPGCLTQDPCLPVSRFPCMVYNRKVDHDQQPRNP